MKHPGAENEWCPILARGTLQDSRMKTTPHLKHMDLAPPLDIPITTGRGKSFMVALS
jgi:hypothetical protein